MSLIASSLRALVLGSGPLRIGQGGEFDYAGVQALKALREEGVHTVLLNPNVASVQTSEGFADAAYFLPVEAEVAEAIIRDEGVNALVAGFGGQTALNCALALADRGVLDRHGVQVLGTPLAAVRATEDRGAFSRVLLELGLRPVRECAIERPEQALEAARRLGFPLIVRGAYSLGGQDAAVVSDPAELGRVVAGVFSSSPSAFLAESLLGWTELEYEVLRDAQDNAIVVAAMENMDPVGVHTGDSVVVAPVLSLGDPEIQRFRDAALRLARALGIVGAINVQFALDPRTGDYRVIEANARVSRSSALASKATAYPIAEVAARLGLGRALPELRHPVTGGTAMCEPALDYVVCKVPRWDPEKFPGAEDRLGPAMQAVGEVMAIGRSFPEALQKALRMLEVGADGLDPALAGDAELRQAVATPTPRRLFAIARALERGMGVAEAATLTGIAPFFLQEMARAVATGVALGRQGPGLERVSGALLATAKRDGYSDAAIARRLGVTEAAVREHRQALEIRPRLRRIDGLGGARGSKSPYYYLSYAASESEAPPAAAPEILVLGAGGYRVGSSAEFDWCGVHAMAAMREGGYGCTLLNCNPATVSTDHQAADRVILDEISLEVILELWRLGRFAGVLAAMGGQTPNRLALALDQAGVRLLGTPVAAIDQAEDRRKFATLLEASGLPQPPWAEAGSAESAREAVRRLGGFPVVVRPSYVLAGAAMGVAWDERGLARHFARAEGASGGHPVVLSRFEHLDCELELDAVAEQGTITLWAVSEHLEAAGVHSGDATWVHPPISLSGERLAEVERVAREVARALRVTGPFNLQLLVSPERVGVLECNLRVSRSFPFASAATGANFAREAARSMLGLAAAPAPGSRPAAFAVKAPQFSTRWLRGADRVLGPEMTATGEAACFGEALGEALLKAMAATGLRVPTRGLSLEGCLSPAGWAALDRLGLPVYQPVGQEEAWPATPLGLEEIQQRMRTGEIDGLLQLGPIGTDTTDRTLRRLALELGLPVIQEGRHAEHWLEALANRPPGWPGLRPWDARGPGARSGPAAAAE